MQLIYLYIEKYKNIVKQDFNFSPEFKCTFDGKNLSVEKIKSKNSIFPDNINVTAIVGKNGSGKTTLLEILFYLLKGREYLSNIKYILLYKQNGLKLKVNNIHINKTENKIFIQIDKSTERFENNCVINIEHSLIKYTKNNIHYNKLMQEQKLRDSENFYIKFPYFLSTINKYKTCIKQIKNDIFFNTFIFNISLFNIDNFCNEIKNNTDSVSILIKKIISDFLELDKKNGLQIINKQKLFEKKIVGVDSILFYNTLFSLLHFIYTNQKFINKKNIKEVIQKIKIVLNLENFTLDKIFKIANIIRFDINDTDFENAIKSQIDTFVYFFKYLKSIKTNFSMLIDENTSFQYKYDIEQNSEIESIIQNTYKLVYFDVDFITNFGIDYINYDFWYLKKDSNTLIIQYKDLSDGEKTILSMITDIIYYVSNHSKASVILLDELDETLHPAWKKRVINILECIFSIINRNIHLILTTHSPFILSDIPKENIIFLKDGKNVSDEVEIDTFGANIHTLLSHGFFMEDGLMGEFAKNKINEVIKFLNDKDSEIKDKDEAKNIINLIGEPIIKNQLQKMLDSKRLDKIDNIDKLEEEIELLKHRLEILRKNQ